MLKWPGQVVIAGCQTTWTTEVSQSLEEGIIADYYQTMLKQVRGGAGVEMLLSVPVHLRPHGVYSMLYSIDCLSTVLSMIYGHVAC